MAKAQGTNCLLNYRVIGDGDQTVVFNHGLVLDNLSSWYFSVALALAEQHRCVLYDLRGHGRSGQAIDGYDTTQLVADLDVVLDAAAVDGPVHLVGNSFGGLVCLEFALAHPRRTKSIALVDCHIGDSTYIDMMTHTLNLDWEGAEEKVQAAFEDWVGRYDEKKTNRVAKNAERLIHETTMVADMKKSPLMTDERLASIAAPTLGIYGSDSDLLDIAHKVEDLMPHAELHLVPGCSHAVLWEATDIVRSKLGDWVRVNS